MVKVRLKWQGQIYNVIVDVGAPVIDFKRSVKAVTGIDEHKQQLVAHGAWRGNLKDDDDLSTFDLADNQMVMLLVKDGQRSAAPAPTAASAPARPLLPPSWASSAAPNASSNQRAYISGGGQALGGSTTAAIPLVPTAASVSEVDPRLKRISWVVGMYLVSVGIALPIPSELYGTDSWAWFYLVFGAVCAAVGLPMMGAYSDRDGRRYTALWSIGLAFFQYWILGFNMDGGGFMYITAKLVGPMSSGVIAMAFAAAADVAYLSNGTILSPDFAYLVAAVGFSFTVGTFLGHLLVAEIGLAVYWGICCPICGLAWFLAYKTWDETNPNKREDESPGFQMQPPGQAVSYQNAVPSAPQPYSGGSNVRGFSSFANSAPPQQQMMNRGGMGGMGMGGMGMGGMGMGGGGMGMGQMARAMRGSNILGMNRPTCCCCIPCIPGCLEINPIHPTKAILNSHPALALMLIPVSLVSLLGATAATWVPDVQDQIANWDVVSAIVFLLVTGSILTFVQVFLIRFLIPRYVPEIRALLIGLLIQAFALVFVSSVSVGWLLYIVAILVGLCSVIAEPCLYSVITLLVPQSNQGCLQGILAGVRALAIGIGIPVFTLLNGNPNVVLLISGISVFVAFLACFLILKTHASGPSYNPLIHVNYPQYRTMLNSNQSVYSVV